ncbi:flagellar basal body isoform B [Chlorella sorokiniana]|nr:flagellar basal body isoform B [Chlorella sorokiniana]|eukprot:PRW58814.1 flagellar basal body isoform B [Chlorella sorokiniana]
MRALESERAGLLRDVALRQEMEGQHAKRGALQAREIRSARTKITSLEKGLEKAALEQQLRAQLADAVAEQTSMRRQLQVRTRELRTVRRLAQQVLLQRSEVEAFLVSSIQMVRAQMAAQAAGAAAPAAADGEAGAQSAAGDHSLGEAAEHLAGQPEQGMAAASDDRGSSSAGMGATVIASAATVEAGGAVQCSSSSCGSPQAVTAATPGAPSTVDIRALSWQDRERVLRLLFAKINRAAVQPVARQPSAAAPLPPLRGLATEAGPAGLA